MELAYDDRLRGTSVKSRVSRNAAEQILNEKRDPADQRGEDITLTIDVQVQFIAEDVLADAVRSSGARWGGVLVSEVATGEILAWAQYPFFNPNNYREASSDIYRNRLAGDSLEPGSTFKPILMAAALEEGWSRRTPRFSAKTAYGAPDTPPYATIPTPTANLPPRKSFPVPATSAWPR